MSATGDWVGDGGGGVKFLMRRSWANLGGFGSK